MSPKSPPRSQWWLLWFLTGVNSFAHNEEVLDLSRWISVQTLKRLASSKYPISLVSPKCPPRSLRCCPWFLSGVDCYAQRNRVIGMSRGIIRLNNKHIKVLSWTQCLAQLAKLRTHTQTDTQTHRCGYWVASQLKTEIVICLRLIVVIRRRLKTLFSKIESFAD